MNHRIVAAVLAAVTIVVFTGFMSAQSRRTSSEHNLKTYAEQLLVVAKKLRAADRPRQAQRVESVARRLMSGKRRGDSRRVRGGRSSRDKSRQRRGKDGAKRRGKAGAKRRGKAGAKRRGKAGAKRRGKAGAKPRGKAGAKPRGKAGAKPRGKAGAKPRGKAGAKPRGKTGAKRRPAPSRRVVARAVGTAQRASQTKQGSGYAKKRAEYAKKKAEYAKKFAEYNKQQRVAAAKKKRAYTWTVEKPRRGNEIKQTQKATRIKWAATKASKIKMAPKVKKVAKVNRMIARGPTSLAVRRLETTKRKHTAHKQQAVVRCPHAGKGAVVRGKAGRSRQHAAAARQGASSARQRADAHQKAVTKRAAAQRARVRTHRKQMEKRVAAARKATAKRTGTLRKRLAAKRRAIETGSRGKRSDSQLVRWRTGIGERVSRLERSMKKVEAVLKKMLRHMKEQGAKKRQTKRRPKGRINI